MTDDGGKTVVCEHDDCGYEWEYSGDLKRATCPSCGKKTAVDGDE